MRSRANERRAEARRRRLRGRRGAAAVAVPAGGELWHPLPAGRACSRSSGVAGRVRHRQWLHGAEPTRVRAAGSSRCRLRRWRRPWWRRWSWPTCPTSSAASCEPSACCASSAAGGLLSVPRSCWPRRVAGRDDAAPLVLLAALAAQFLCDLAASTVRDVVAYGSRLREQLAEVVGLCRRPRAHARRPGRRVACHRPALEFLALLPLLVLLGIFGRERRRRVESLVELNSAYRGTALLLGDVIEATTSTRASTHAASSSSRSTSARASASTTTSCATWSSARSCMTSARS